MRVVVIFPVILGEEDEFAQFLFGCLLSFGWCGIGGIYAGVSAGMGVCACVGKM